MEYRMNRRTGDQISVLGLGTRSISSAGEREGVKTLRLAFEQGINYFDLATAESENFPTFGKAFSHFRDKVFYQIHFGAVYGPGRSYSWTTDLKTVQRSVDWQRKALDTDYIDYGFIHCLDEASDWEKRRPGLPAEAERGRGGTAYRPVLPHAGAGPPGAGHRPGGYAHVQHQPGL